MKENEMELKGMIGNNRDDRNDMEWKGMRQKGTKGNDRDDRE